MTKRCRHLPHLNSRNSRNGKPSEEASMHCLSRYRSAITILLSLACTCAHAQPAAPKWPSKPVRLVLGYAPGGATDIVARAVAQRLTESWGVQVVVENRPGADTIIATEVVANAP